MSESHFFTGDKRMSFGKFVIANIKIKNRKYEILVDPDKAWELKKQIRVFQIRRTIYRP